MARVSYPAGYALLVALVWGWAIAVTIIPILTIALAYGLLGVLMQTGAELWLARYAFEPDRYVRNGVAIGLLSLAHGLQLELLVSGRTPSMPIFLMMFGLMFVALVPMALLQTFLPQKWRLQPRANAS